MFLKDALPHLQLSILLYQANYFAVWLSTKQLLFFLPLSFSIPHHLSTAKDVLLILHFLISKLINFKPIQ